MYRALWAFFRPYRFILIMALILQAIAGISSLVPWIAISQIADSSVHHYYTWALMALLGGVTWLVCQTLALYLTHQTDNHLCYQLRLKLIDKLGKLPLRHFIHQGKEGIQQTVDRDVRLLHQLTAHAPADIVKLLIVPVVATLILLWQNPILFFFCLLPLIAAVYLFKQMRSPRYQFLYEGRNQSLARLYQQYAELADNPLLARQFPNKAIQKTTIESLNVFQNAFNQWIGKIGALSSLTQIGISTTLLTLWVILGTLLLPHPTPLPQIILFVLLMHSIAAPVAAMGHGADALNLALGAAERITQLLQQPEMHYGEKSLHSAPCSLNINQVSYISANKSILSDLNLQIKYGEFIAIVGASGAGKSTLLQLMARYLDPSQGTLYFDNTPLPEFSFDGLNQQVAIVMQNTEPMPCSIQENLQLFAPNVQPQQIQYYLDALDLTAIIEQQPKGLNSIIGTDITLSGGEAQRLAIARVLLSDAPILLFDEPTSALDPQNAQRVLDLLHQEKRTCVLVTHSLSCLPLADRILLMEDGKLVTEGTHHQLAQNSLAYQQLLSALEENND